MQELQLLNDKLDLLLKKYTALRAENERLKQTIAEQTRSIEGLNFKLHQLEEDLMAAQKYKSAMSGEEKDNMRQQLDTVIGEIDKILTTLND